MEKFNADFDPLSALDAEYAAVVARTRQQNGAPSIERPEAETPSDKDDQDPAQSDDEITDDDAFDAGEMYAPLPADSDEEFQDEHYNEDNNAAVASTDTTTSVPLPLPLSPPPMDASTKQSIMAAMQSLSLQPPPWAIDADIPDDELVELVQNRLRGPAQEAPSQVGWAAFD